MTKMANDSPRHLLTRDAAVRPKHLRQNLATHIAIVRPFVFSLPRGQFTHEQKMGLHMLRLVLQTKYQCDLNTGVHIQIPGVHFYFSPDIGGKLGPKDT